MQITVKGDIIVGEGSGMRQLVIIPRHKEGYAALAKFDEALRKKRKDGEPASVLVTVKETQRPKTFKQNAAFHAVLTRLYEACYGESPTKEDYEEYRNAFYEEFAQRKPVAVQLGGQKVEKLLPTRISGASIEDGIKLVQTAVDLLMEQTGGGSSDYSVRAAIEEHEAFIGAQKKDPRDYDKEGRLLLPSAWAAGHSYCMACHAGGAVPLHTHHIQRRRTRPDLTDHAENFLRLCHNCHAALHDKGSSAFLKKHNHLKARHKRAQGL